MPRVRVGNMLLTDSRTATQTGAPLLEIVALLADVVAAVIHVHGG